PATGGARCPAPWSMPCPACPVAVPFGAGCRHGESVKRGETASEGIAACSPSPLRTWDALAHIGHAATSFSRLGRGGWAAPGVPPRPGSGSQRTGHQERAPPGGLGTGVGHCGTGLGGAPPPDVPGGEKTLPTPSLACPRPPQRIAAVGGEDTLPHHGHARRRHPTGVD